MASTALSNSYSWPPLQKFRFVLFSWTHSTIPTNERICLKVLCPYLIILRIAGGRAWESPTSTTVRSTPQTGRSQTNKSTWNTTRGGSSSVFRPKDFTRGPQSGTFELSNLERTSEGGESINDKPVRKAISSFE